MPKKGYQKRRRTLTPAFVMNCKKPKQGAVYWTDEGHVPGLTFHVDHVGKRTFRFMYRVLVGKERGPTRKLTLGTYPQMTLADARSEAAKYHDMAKDGIDPKVQRDEATLAVQREASKTFKSYAEDYAEAALASKKVRRSKGGPGTISLEAAKTRARDLRDVVIPALGHRPIADITRAEIAAFLDMVEKEKKAQTRVDRMLIAIKAVFNFAVMRGYVDESPARSIDTRAVLKKRDHSLNDDEIKPVWDAAGAVGGSFGAVIRMLMLTGQRLGEMAKARWSAVDFDEATMMFPGGTTKPGRDHLIPLSRPAIDVLLSLPRGGDNDLIFGPTLITDNWKRLMPKLYKATRGEVRHWTAHDLRRTVAEGLSKLDYHDMIVALILNHAPGKGMQTTRDYVRKDPVNLKEKPLKDWAKHVMKIVNPPPDGEVVDFPSRRKTA